MKWVLRDQMVEAFFLKHEVHVARSVAMPLQLHQQFSHRAIVRNRVRHWRDGVEPEHTLLVTMHHSSLIRAFSPRILHVVEAFAVRFPDVDLDALYCLPVRILDCAQHQTWFSVGVVSDLRAIRLRLGFVRVKRSEHRSFGRGGRLRVIDAVDEKRETENVG